MTRQLFSWFAKHQVLAISALNAALIISLAVVLGLGTDRTHSRHLVWALDTSAEAPAPGRKDSAGRAPAKSPTSPQGLPLPEKTPAQPERGEEPGSKPVEPIEPPPSSAIPEAPLAVQTAAQKPAARKPLEPTAVVEAAGVVEKAPALKPVEKRQGFPARSAPQRPGVRTLRARPVPPTQRGRILRPRQ